MWEGEISAVIHVINENQTLAAHKIFLKAYFGFLNNISIFLFAELCVKLECLKLELELDGMLIILHLNEIFPKYFDII